MVRRTDGRSEVYPFPYPRLPTENLRDFLGKRLQRVRPAVEALDETLLGTDEQRAEAVADLVEHFRVDELVLGESGLDSEVRKVTTETTDPRVLGFGQTSRRIKVDEVTLVIPLEGDSALLHRWPPDVSAREPVPSTWTDPRTSSIRIPLMADPRDGNGSRLNTLFQEEDQNLRKLVAATNVAVAAWNEALPSAIQSAIDARVRGLDQRSAVLGGLQFPTVVTTSGPVPARLPRRQRPPRPAPTREHGQYLLLEDEDLREVVAVIRRWADYIPDHPKVVKDKGENDLRDELLHNLNTKWDATGETFTNKGKTDIRALIATADDTGVSALVFKAECKMWDDAGCVTEAFEQLADLYLTSRENRTALILFVPDAEQMKTAEDRAVKRLIERHAGKPLGIEMSGWPVVDVPHPDDADRNVRTVVIVIDVSVLPPES